MELAIKTVFLLCISCIAITMQNTNQAINEIEESNYNNFPPTNFFRNKRAVLKKKTGPVRQIFGLFFEQWNDTRLTIDSINELINNNFLPENASLTTTTPTPNLNISTKPPPFKLTRSEAARIFKRNLKGLARLLNLEWRDAIKQSKITNKEFKKNLSAEIGKFL